MKFALNYSPAAAKLLQQGVIQIDLFKTADWPDMIADAQRYAPVCVHFSIDAGSGKPVDLEAVEKMQRQTSTQFINVHLAARKTYFPNAEEPIILQKVKCDLDPILARFGHDNVIAENLIYTGDNSDYLRPAVEAQNVQEIVRSADCGFLLDLSHARIAAHYMKVDAKQYIESLPLDRLRELHVTGLGMHNGTLTDHLAMTDEDWSFTDWALDRIQKGAWRTPAIVAFEYGGSGQPFAWRTDPAVIASQVPRLYDMVHSK